jgi:hypothetical protein
MREFGVMMDWLFIIGFLAATVFVCHHLWHLDGGDDDAT